MTFISKENFERVLTTQGKLIEQLSKISREKAAADLLDFRKPEEQISLLQRFVPNHEIRGDKVLEVGSGYGIFQLIARKKYGADCWGLEPSSPGFDDAFQISRSILIENGLSIEQIIHGVGEHMPFENNSFDIVFSTNVLEHVENPAQVLKEVIRVCKPGGIAHIVVPNFGSFFDGHYACFYIPYQPKWLWKMYLRYILRRDPGFVDSLRTEINYFAMMKILKRYIQNNEIKMITMGEEIFRERMKTLSFTPWAGLVKVQRWVTILHTIGLIPIAIVTALALKAYSPLIITFRKR